MALAALGGCGASEPDKAFKYKMIVEVETPQGLCSGSSVRELHFRSGGKGSSWVPSLGQNRPRVKLRGEAVAIDLPNGRTLFALLTGADGDVDYAARIADRSGLWSVKNPRPTNEPIELWPNAPDTERQKNTSPVPMLVTLGDVSDPTSVERVDPDNLEASFGKDARFDSKAITVQVTDDEVTTGIEKRLGWLLDENRKRFDPNLPPQGIPLGNFSGLFSTELF